MKREDRLIRFDWAIKRIQEARNKLRYVSLSKAEQAAYDKYYHDEASFVYTQKRELEIAHEDGLAEGKRSKAYEISKKLFAKGMDMSDIAETTGLSPDDIASLTH